MDLAEQNLYSFYSFLGKSKEITLLQGHNFNTVYAGKGLWPQMIFNINYKKERQEVIEEINYNLFKKDTPLYFAANKTYINETHVELLNRFRIIPLVMWRGMSINLASVSSSSPIEDVTIQKISEPSLIKQASDLINNDMMTNLSLSEKLLQELCNFSNFRLYGLFLKGILISVLVVFCEGLTAGVYFVVTSRNFRKKGFASFLLKSVSIFLLKEGFNHLALQAEKNAFDLYKKVGFFSTCDIIVYGKREE